MQSPECNITLMTSGLGLENDIILVLHWVSEHVARTHFCLLMHMLLSVKIALLFQVILEFEL